ncbi:Erg29 protein [Maudiozyma humilis]|uniref:Erg29 protein n=1 Tax=Maudiozyma humilis TaxID=51915 RepID=A0AAV5RU06_MAUHU|nr:Erg29 protein [Kazachstania humilis]
MGNLTGSFVRQYFEVESRLIDALSTAPYIHQFIHGDPLSGRITLYLIILGGFALIQEIWVSIEMTLLQKETYDELSVGRIDEGIKLHRMIQSDDYHAKEYKDEKSGIIIEEFEDMDKFFSKPVHVSDVFVNGQILVNGESVLDKPLRYHIEFSPEDFEDEKRQDFGCSLHVLRLKLYHLFKDSSLFREYNGAKEFTISRNVRIFNKIGEVLPTNIDEVQLCFLKIETGDTITCEFIID